MEDCFTGGSKLVAWTAAIHEKYMMRLVSALRHARQRGRFEPATHSVSARSRAVKAAADLSLAMTAGGRTAWSRAILAQSRKNVNSRRSAIARSDTRQHSTKTGDERRSRLLRITRSLRGRGPGSASRKKSTPGPRSHCGRARTVGEQLRTLKGLVPGSGAMDTPVLLREAADYIAALKMQVETMRALANCCANASR